MVFPLCQCSHFVALFSVGQIYYLHLTFHAIEVKNKSQSTKAPNGWERSRKVEQQIMLLGGRCEGWMMAIVGCSFCSGGAVDVGVPHWDSGHIHMLENNQ